MSDFKSYFHIFQSNVRFNFVQKKKKNNPFRSNTMIYNLANSSIFFSRVYSSSEL